MITIRVDVVNVNIHPKINSKCLYKQMTIFTKQVI